MTSIEDVVTGVLREGLDDWVPVDVLLWYARRASSGSTNSFKEIVVAALKFLLNEELAVVGDIGEAGFERWESTTQESVDRITAGCEAMNWEPLGGLCWLSNTPNGDQVALNSAFN